MALIRNKEIWREFFQMYKELTELWRVRSDDFKDKTKKRIAWEKLLIKYKEIEPDSNLEGLKQRVTNIRSCYRRELKKVERSIRLSVDPLDIYVPSLWYFDELDFLRDQGEPVFETSAMKLENEMIEQDKTSDFDYQMQKRRKTIDEDLAEKNELLQNVYKHFKHTNSGGPNERDEARIYSESWSTSFRKMSEIQKIYAKKAIEDILVLGQLGKLTLNSVPMPSSHCCPPETLTPINSIKISPPLVLERSQSPQNYEYYNNQSPSQNCFPPPGSENLDIVIKRRDSL